MLVDPLDGTKEFISRNGEFTVNIALIEDGVPVIGRRARPGARACLCRERRPARGRGALSADMSGVDGLAADATRAPPDRIRSRSRAART